MSNIINYGLTQSGTGWFISRTNMATVGVKGLRQTKCVKNLSSYVREKDANKYMYVYM